MELLKTYLDPVVFSLLGLMAFVATWFTLERILFYRQLALDTDTHPATLHVDLTRNLTLISTVGANAPYVGLLGTVLGILVTFYDLGMSQSIDTGQIMVGLAMALKATAGGIAVAIPSIMAYNLLMRQVDVKMGHFKAMSAEERSRHETL